MKKHEPLSTAKAVIALLTLTIASVIFYKFYTNQNYFFDDIEALRNYVIFAIVGGGLLIGLLYLTSQTTHQVKTNSKASKKKRK
ncbi:MAG TPA: hypothetical protein VLG12_03430 [Candidatus Saccharimonadales bacterium]|nr:hypothetical protein [Candidatus Saccharimonadales bacterium]